MKTKWISVKKELPTLDEHGESDYLLCYAFPGMFVGWYNNLGNWIVAHYYAKSDPLRHGDIPTHWMPLPKSPEK